MKPHDENLPTTDEFDLVELGSVLVETRGIPGAQNEYNLGSPVSRD